jgi:Holliday junction resolvase RusA-like endonuclease
MTAIAFTVHGLPAAQGSKRHVGHGIMVESSKALKPWREAVKYAALDAIGKASTIQLTGPLALRVTFWFPRPKSHYRTGKNAHLLRGDAPQYKSSMPDLIRATEDALTDSGLWRDDALVVRLSAVKMYSNSSFVGAALTIISGDAQLAEVAA